MIGILEYAHLRETFVDSISICFFQQYSPFPSSEKECFHVAEGIFDVMAVFNATNEYVLYYHSGSKTIRWYTTFITSN